MAERFVVLIETPEGALIQASRDGTWISWGTWSEADLQANRIAAEGITSFVAEVKQVCTAIDHPVLDESQEEREARIEQAAVTKETVLTAQLAAVQVLSPKAIPTDVDAIALAVALAVEPISIKPKG